MRDGSTILALQSVKKSYIFHFFVYSFFIIISNMAKLEKKIKFMIINKLYDLSIKLYQIRK